MICPECLNSFQKRTNARTCSDACSFWHKVDRSAGDDGCWPWKGATDKDGYGQFAAYRDASLGTRSHRVAMQLAHGGVPSDVLVCHKCDNPPCCNPAHLFLGTVSDNNIDRDTKGRCATGDRSGRRTKPESYAGKYTGPKDPARGDRNGSRVHRDRMPRGEGHVFAKLTYAAVVAIRQRVSAGETRASLAMEYNVHPGTVEKAFSGRTWAHVT